MLGFTSFNPTYTVVQMMIKARNSLTWERGRPACIFTAGGTPALPDISKWASYLSPFPKLSRVMSVADITDLYDFT
jgi:hypothetical protein